MIRRWQPQVHTYYTLRVGSGLYYVEFLAMMPSAISNSWRIAPIWQLDGHSPPFFPGNSSLALELARHSIFHVSLAGRVSSHPPPPPSPQGSFFFHLFEGLESPMAMAKPIANDRLRILTHGLGIGLLPGDLTCRRLPRSFRRDHPASNASCKRRTHRDLTDLWP